MELWKRQRYGPKPPCIGAGMHDAWGVFAMLPQHAELTELHCIHHDSLPAQHGV